MFPHAHLAAAGRRRPLALLALIALTASAAAAEPRRDATRVHRVEPGETVWRIARRYGSSVESIMTRNGLRDVRRIRAGSTLAIPLERTTHPPATRRPQAPSDAGDALEALLPELERAVHEARFEEALRLVGAASQRLAAGSDAASRRRIARVALLAATAEIAFGRRDAALAHLARALAADPELSLDPQATSPKVLRVFQAARILAVR